MNRAFVLLLGLIIWLSSCAKIIPYKTNNYYQDLWQPIIAFLNQDSSYKSAPPIDLVKQYRLELLKLDDEWRQFKSPSSPPDNLKDKYKFFHEKIVQRNAQEIEHIVGYKTPQPPKNYRALAREILSKIDSFSKASVKNIQAYSDGDEIGFCFGRALLMHFHLLKAKVPQEHIFKVFVLGDLRFFDKFWQFHVVIVLKNEDGLLVMDLLYGEPVDYASWAKDVQALEMKHPYSLARFFITDPRKFMPSSGFYDVALLIEPAIKKFFFDVGLEVRAQLDN